MTLGDVRAAAEQLVQFHDRFAPLFGKKQAQDHAYDYLKGLLVCPERKSIEPIALNVGHGDVSGLQKFIGAGVWPYDDVQAEAQSLFVDELVPSAAGSPLGVVGVVDESAFTKKGTHSAGVARQHNGRLGKEDNCQVGVFLLGVTPAGSALLDHQLFLPELWCEPTREAKDRRAEAHIPEGLRFRTKPRIAAELIRSRSAGDDGGLDGQPGRLHPGLLGARPRADGPRPRRGAHGRCAGRRVTRFRLAGAAGACGGSRPAGLRVRGGAGLVDAAPPARPAGPAVDPSLAGGEAGAQVLHLQRRGGDPAVDTGPGVLHPLTGGGFLRGLQELLRHGAVRDTVVDRVAPPHDTGRAGAPVRDLGAEAAPKKLRS